MSAQGPRASCGPRDLSALSVSLTLTVAWWVAPRLRRPPGGRTETRAGPLRRSHHSSENTTHDGTRAHGSPYTEVSGLPAARLAPSSPPPPETRDTRRQREKQEKKEGALTRKEHAVTGQLDRGEGGRANVCTPPSPSPNDAAIVLKPGPLHPPRSPNECGVDRGGFISQPARPHTLTPCSSPLPLSFHPLSPSASLSAVLSPHRRRHRIASHARTRHIDTDAHTHNMRGLFIGGGPRGGRATAAGCGAASS